MKKHLLLLLPVLFALTACSPRHAPGTGRAPVIGISSSGTVPGSCSAPATYVRAVRKAGGTVLAIPLTETPGQAASVMETLDGIVFTGGEDITPGWYGEEVLNETVESNIVRDRSDSLLARAALAAGKPILGICRGAQLINVVLGGSLYQDLPTQRNRGVVHGGGNMHAIGLEKGSVLFRIFGTDSLTINSYHHQAVKEPFDGMRVTARAADGLIEAYEADGIWAVQFHPEKMLNDGQTAWLAFFEAFIEHCRQQSSDR